MSAAIAVTGIANGLQPFLLSPVTKILKDTSLLVITLLSNADTLLGYASRSYRTPLCYTSRILMPPAIASVS